MRASIENQLLHASLLCGMVPNGKPAYRLQLCFVANRELGSKSRQSDFQRALETGVDSKGLWDNFGYRGSGEYVITDLGYKTAKVTCGEIKAEYQPVRADQFKCRAIGTINKLHIQILTFGKKSEVFINDKECRPAQEACRIIENGTNLHFSTAGESAVRVLYNMAVDQGFELILGE
jgi:hypothetical protein